MTKEQKIEIFTRRLNGETYHDIAKSFGVSRQYIESLLKTEISGYKGGKLHKMCIYKGLSDYMMSHQTTTHDLCKMIGINSTQHIYRKVRGESKFNIEQIEKILAATGMTFEKYFSHKGN